jgi:hypothetical protein
VEPSSDRPAGSGASALKRWGPLAAIVVVIAIVVAVVVVGGDDDDDGTDTAGPGNGDGEVIGGGGEPPEGAISWTRAEEEGLDVEWGEGCDTETGRVALPYYFAPECYANATPDPDAPAVRGVTDDEIVVVVFQSQENDPVLGFITGAIANDDTNAEVADTYRGYVELFQSAMQTYGRTVRLEFLTASGITTDEVTARADAVRAAEELGAFAVWGAPITNAWAQELHARGVICLGCSGVAEPDPYLFSITPGAHQTRAHLVEYISKRLAGQPAEHAGDPAMQDQERVFGHLVLDTGSQEARDNITATREALAAEGVELAEQIGYELDPARLQEQAGSAVARMKAAGVTSVIFQGDPVAPTAFTQEATAQEWFPEWILGGGVLVDATAFGRSYEQTQWASAFGISALAARIDPEVSAPFQLYQWFHGEDPPAADTSPVLWPNVSLFFSGLQAAGPNLTPESFRDGLFSANVLGGAISQPTVTYGERGFWDEPDYHGIDDFTEIWWDPDAEGPDEIRRAGQGMYRYSEGGRRFLPGEWTEESRAFVVDGSVTIYEEIPPGEEPRSYPPPR